MTLLAADRVGETTTTTGTGDLVLGGAVAGLRTFAAVCANGDTVGYAVFTAGGTEFETGEGTYNSSTNALARSIVASSSNAGALVSLSAGTKTVICTLLAAHAPRLKPLLPAFPSITNLRLRISAELSPMVLSQNGLVTSINDISGSGTGVNFTGSAPTKPRWIERGMSMLRPVIAFDGLTNKLTSAAAFAVTQPMTIVVAFENWRVGTGNSNLVAAGSSGPHVYLAGGTSWSLYAGATVSSAALFQQNRQGVSPQMAAPPAVFMATFNGAASLMANNGVEVVVGDPSSTNMAGTHYIGTDGSGGHFACVHLYEYLVFSRVLTLAERGQLNAYYAQALGIKP